MIPAAVWPRFARWFARHAGRRIRAQFGSVRVHGLQRLREQSSQGPVLMVANHSSWWDAMLALWLSRAVLRHEAYALMDATNLARHPYLCRAGGFGVRGGSRSDGAAAIRYAAAQLQRPGQAVWVFPQGAERPWHEPLRFAAGAVRIATLAPRAALVPLALAYTFGEHEQPDAWVSIGAPLRSPTRASLRTAVEHERGRILRGLEGSAAFDSYAPRRTRWGARGASYLLRLIASVGLRNQPPAATETQRALPPGDPASDAGAEPRDQ